MLSQGVRFSSGIEGAGAPHVMSNRGVFNAGLIRGTVTQFRFAGPGCAIGSRLPDPVARGRGIQELVDVRGARLVTRVSQYLRDDLRAVA
jgi:hypothetical protein